MDFINLSALGILVCQHIQTILRMVISLEVV